MSTELAPITASAIAEQVAIVGDLVKLTPEQRMSYYGEVCRSVGLNPLTRPFEYITLNERLTLYARRDATDQLRKIHNVNVSIVARETIEGVYVVTAHASMPDGRTDEAIGAVPLIKELGEWKSAQSGKRYFVGNGQYQPLSPDDRANAMMKAETKAKRRVTLSIVGLGWLDESEIDTIRGAKRPAINYDTGEILDIDQPDELQPPPRVSVFPKTPVAAGAGQRKRATMLDRIATLTAEAEQLDLEIILTKPLDEMTDAELIEHGTNLKAAIAAANSQELAA